MAEEPAHKRPRDVVPVRIKKESQEHCHTDAQLAEQRELADTAEYMESFASRAAKSQAVFRKMPAKLSERHLEWLIGAYREEPGHTWTQAVSRNVCGRIMKRGVELGRLPPDVTVEGLRSALKREQQRQESRARVASDRATSTPGGAASSSTGPR